MAYNPPEEYERYDDYDAYEISRTEFVQDFIEKHLDYVLNGGKVGLPISALQKYPNTPWFPVVDYARPRINGKYKYARLIYQFNFPEEIRDSIVLSVGEDGSVYPVVLIRHRRNSYG